MGYGGGSGSGGYGATSGGDQFIEKPPLQPTPSGALRFNTDSSKLEYYDGNQWVNITSTSPEAQTGGGRGVFAAGLTPSTTDVIQFVQINTTGNSVDFGDLTQARYETGVVSDRTRGLWTGGYVAPTKVNTIDYVTISIKGNAIDFGDLATARGHMSSGCNSTRGVMAGGQSGSSPSFSNTNVIEYVTIQALGDSIDFGDLTAGAWFAGNGRSNSTRVLFAGGASPSENNSIEYVIIATLGNAADFGDIITKSYGMGAGNASNAVRAVFFGGTDKPDPHTDVIQYNTFATLGNSTDFGDLSQSRRGGGAVSDCIRGVYAGGRNPSNVDTIDYVQIMTTGNAVDFGNLLGVTAFNNAGASNGHGGLG